MSGVVMKHVHSGPVERCNGVRKEVKMKTRGRAGLMEVLASSLRGTQVIG